MDLSQTEENYLKAIYKLLEQSSKSASTSAVASRMETSAASVTDMLRKLGEKDLIFYEKYKGARLTEQGRKVATMLIRSHRLWEVFLLEKLDFKWDEVHDVAEQLEHVQSTKLIDELDRFLDFPKFDPHGDPIPDQNGRFTLRHQIGLHQLEEDETAILVGVKEHSKMFLNHLDQLQLKIGASIKVNRVDPYDEMVQITIDGSREEKVSRKVSEKILVQRT